MKNLLIALIALTMTLGVACKKSEVEQVKPELNLEKIQTIDSDGVTHDPNSITCNCSDCRAGSIPPIKPPKG